MKTVSSMFLTLFLCSTTPALAENAPGLVEREIFAPHHGRAMQMAVWYPSTGGTAEIFAENRVFYGGEVSKNAKPTPGKHPVVLLSHGMGGTYLSLNWLASGLAAKGAVVVSVNHPNGSFRDRDPQKMFNHWTRVQDLQVALNNVLSDKRFTGVVDADRVYATGFSFGGWTALSIAGATADPTGSFAYCHAAGERSQTCTDLKRYGLDPAEVNRAQWTASYKDARVKAVAAIDPGLTWNMHAENVRDLDQNKLMIIGLGTGVDRLYATDTSVFGSKFEALVPKSRVEVLAPAMHFTAMPLCKPDGIAILEAEKDDPVCSDPAGTDRKAVHDQIIALIAAQFDL